MRIPDSATKKYGPGDKVQEKQTVCCHLLDSFMFGCCSGYKVAMAMSIFFQCWLLRSRFIWFSLNLNQLLKDNHVFPHRDWAFPVKFPT